MARSTNKQYCFYLRESFQRGQVLHIGDGQGRDMIDALPIHSQRFAAGGQDFQTRAKAQQLFGQLGAGFHQVLAVIQDQQERFPFQKLNQRVFFSSQAAHPQGCQHRPGDQGWVSERCQVYKPNPVGETFQQSFPSLQAQAGFPCPARASQRNQPALPHQNTDFINLLLAADKAGDLRGQVMFECTLFHCWNHGRNCAQQPQFPAAGDGFPTCIHPQFFIYLPDIPFRRAYRDGQLFGNLAAGLFPLQESQDLAFPPGKRPGERLRKRRKKPFRKRICRFFFSPFTHSISSFRIKPVERLSLYQELLDQSG